MLVAFVLGYALAIVVMIGIMIWLAMALLSGALTTAFSSSNDEVELVGPDGKKIKVKKERGPLGFGDTGMMNGPNGQKFQDNGNGTATEI